MRWVLSQQSKPCGGTSLPQETHLYFACKAVIEGKTAPFIQGTTLYDKKKAEEYVSRIEQANKDLRSHKPLAEDAIK
ncbi:MAG: hypothetical protein QXT25_01435 [Candidatus Anstonellaceae archaeon]